MTCIAKVPLAAALSLALAPVWAQTPGNLVPNPGFEEFTRCPGDFSESVAEFNVPGWQSASTGTPDHFHSCSAGEANVPYNWAGVADAYEGHGYAGIYVWMANGYPYREYLQCRLSRPLVKDSTYQISFRFKLSSYSKFAVDRIGLLLSDTAISMKSDRVLDKRPTLSVIRDSALTRTTGLWEKAEMTYQATGGEAFLVIGNFFSNANTRYYEIIFRPIVQPMLAESAYYYIDHVEVIPNYIVRDTLDLLPRFSLPDTDLDVTYVLDDIRFEYDSYKLIYSSFDQLDRVVEFLFKNPDIKVQLFGHTDDRGGDRYNQELSVNRAKSVSAYLAYAGINPRRIEVFGFGKKRPLVDEQTEHARSINRRVEVRFIR